MDEALHTSSALLTKAEGEVDAANAASSYSHPGIESERPLAAISHSIVTEPVQSKEVSSVNDGSQIIRISEEGMG